MLVSNNYKIDKSENQIQDWNSYMMLIWNLDSEKFYLQSIIFRFMNYIKFLRICLQKLFLPAAATD